MDEEWNNPHDSEGNEIETNPNAFCDYGSE
jgi:hypothetical protein